MLKLIGPWGSGYTRRVGITLKLLDIPFEHLNWTGAAWRESIRRFSPMVKVPALVLEDDEVIVDSSAIIDFLYEIAGLEKSMLPVAGAERRLALYHSAIASEIYGKQIQIYQELSQHEFAVTARVRYFLQQVLAGFQAIEHRAKGKWLQGDKISHADVMAVVAFQSTADNPIFADVNASNFPHLSRVVEQAMSLPAFLETYY